LIDALAIILQHLVMSRPDNRLTQIVDFPQGIAQTNFLKGLDAEISEGGHEPEQDDAGKKSIFRRQAQAHDFPGN
jgi:hypothetical protein